VQAVGGEDKIYEYETSTYLINVYLPNNVAIVGVRAAEGRIAEADVLLGMDIIAGGDFAVTNANGETHWTFRYPSNESIDFVEEINEYNKKHSPPMPLTPDEIRRRRNKAKKEKQKARRR